MGIAYFIFTGDLAGAIGITIGEFIATAIIEGIKKASSK